MWVQMLKTLKLGVFGFILFSLQTFNGEIASHRDRQDPNQDVQLDIQTNVTGIGVGDGKAQGLPFLKKTKTTSNDICGRYNTDIFNKLLINLTKYNHDYVINRQNFLKLILSIKHRKKIRESNYIIILINI